jgi:HlyD family secretion protein
LGDSADAVKDQAGFVRQGVAGCPTVNGMNYDAKIDANEALAEPMDSEDDLAPAQGESVINRRMVLIGLAVVLLLVGLWFVNRFVAPAELATNAGQQAPVVTVLQPGRASVTGEIKSTGTLAARRELPVGVVGEGGRVERVLVEPGDWVAAGQVLAVIDRSVQVQQAAGLEAQIGVAAADARLAQANLDRALKLVDRGFISKADVDRLTANRDAASARVRVAQAQLRETRARNSRLNIVAPSAGLVLDRQVEPAQVVGAGSGVLFRIAKGGEMELRANLTEEALAQITTGVRATVTPVGSAKAFTGEVWQISPVIDPQTGREQRASPFPMHPNCGPAASPKRSLPPVRSLRPSCRNRQSSLMTRAAMSTLSARTTGSSVAK